MTHYESAHNLGLGVVVYVARTQTTAIPTDWDYKEVDALGLCVDKIKTRYEHEIVPSGYVHFYIDEV